MSAIRDEIIQAMKEFLGTEGALNFQDTTWVADLSLDSLALFHFLIFLEKRFSLTFSDEDFTNAETSDFSVLVGIVDSYAQNSTV